MSGMLIPLLFLAMALVAGSLFVGLFFLARGGKGDALRSNRAMKIRVTMQGIAILLFLIAMITQA